MIADLGKYAAEVLSAYAATAALLGGIVAASVWRSAQVRRRLEEAERRASDAG